LVLLTALPWLNRYGRSVYSDDGGVTWTTPVLIADVFGIDGLNVASGGSSSEGVEVVVTFHVNTSEPTNATSATWLHYSLSNDGGATWGTPPKVVSLDGGATPAIACSMCMTKPRFDSDTGMVHISYRSAIDNVRAFRVVSALGAETNEFKSTVVNPTDNWVIDYCPMNGPQLSLTPSTGNGAGEAQYVAFMTDSANNVYWNMRDGGSSGASSAFSSPVPTPRNEANERYPTAVGTKSQDVVMVWNVGPMAVSGTAEVKWACWAKGNTTAAQGGLLGTSFAGTKATALAVGNDQFMILTTAA